MFQRLQQHLSSSVHARWLTAGVVMYAVVCGLNSLSVSDDGGFDNGFLTNAVQASAPFSVLPQNQDNQTATGNEVQTVSVMLPSGMQQIVIHDTRTMRMAVYHIDGGSGRIQLKSVRDLTWDLKMEHFNGQSPLPAELKQMQP